LNVRVIRDAETRVFWDTIDVFTREQAAAEGREDGEAEAAARVECGVGEFFVDFCAREQGVAGLFDALYNQFDDW
jgi:hypothetical protein